MNAPFRFDFKAPDYSEIVKTRSENLDRLRSSDAFLASMKNYYRDNPADFINDWGWTFDPRNLEVGLPTLVPFILFPKQREWIDWVVEHWKGRTPGLCEKSRDMGVSWLAMALGCTLCIFNEGMVVGVGSRKTEYVDKLGTLKPLLPKGRVFVENLPPEFVGGWAAWRDAPYMRITFPTTGSMIGGEGGNDVGRGDRTSIYFVDEFAHFERPELVEASLSQTTNCRIDMSSVRGMNNPFARKRWEGKVDVFVFDWRDDPRKDDAWYKKQQAELDPVVVAQEIDRDYQASVSGVVIPGPWVKSCINAREKLGHALQGRKRVALDVADEGKDKNAISVCDGFEIERSEEWTGKNSDIFSTVERAFEVCDEFKINEFRYDADGIGAGVRGDARIINERRAAASQRAVTATGYRGSEAVFDPEGIVEGTIGSDGTGGRTNQDYFANRKAQNWWLMRKRAQRTHRWITEGIKCNPDDLLSISPKDPNHMKLVAELSQATYKTNGVGKIVVDKAPDGMKSPNLADAAVINYAQMEPPPFVVTSELLAAVAKAGRMRR